MVAVLLFNVPRADMCNILDTTVSFILNLWAVLIANEMSGKSRDKEPSRSNKNAIAF